jgi:hypothetical protein
VTPVGGPGGYTSANNLMNDSFGTAGASKVSPGTSAANPANYTATSQFFSTTQPDSSYGINGHGWDGWMNEWGCQAPGFYLNATMQSDHLEIDPGGGNPPELVSHLEFNPTATESYYIEVRAQWGRGVLPAAPAFWSETGNESTSMTICGGTHTPLTNGQKETDYMSTWFDQPWGSPLTAVPGGSGYVSYIDTSMLGNINCPSCTEVGTDNGGLITQTCPPAFGFGSNCYDITDEWHVWGFEDKLNSSGYPVINVYFDGVYQGTLTSTTQLAPGLTPRAVVMGWNPGSSAGAPPPNQMNIDYVRVWKKP